MKLSLCCRLILFPVSMAIGCGGGGATNPDGGGMNALPATVHVVPGSDLAGADGSLDHPFPALYDAVGAIATNTGWTGGLQIHEGRHELLDEVIVSSRAALEILPGAKFYLGPTASIHAQADVNVHGTEANPVLFTWLVAGTHWKSFTNFEPTSQANVVEWAIFEHGGESEFNGSSMRGALSIRQAGGRFSHDEFRFNEGDDGMNIRASNSIIENCYFHDNFNDALDSDTAASVAGGKVEVRNSRFVANGNDGVDLGEGSTAYVHDNTIWGNGDKGVSIGETSFPTIEHNLIVACNTGIGIKDMSDPIITNNTIVGCNVGVYVYQGIQGRGSGKGTFKNGIIWGSIAADVAITNVNADMSQTAFSYSCIQSSTYRTDLMTAGNAVPITGEGMLFSGGKGCDDPMFAAPGTIPPPMASVGQTFALGDFHLKSMAGRWDPATKAFVTDTATSPCIDKADQATGFDKEVAPNGGRADLGNYGGTAEASKTP